jgi:YegS/Rv2252/BmrU family lipid kinase
MIEISDKRPLHLVINPHSGYGGQRLLLGEMRRQFAKAGMPLVEYTTCAPGDATRYARQVAPTAGAVVVWGGDGTVSEIASGLAGTDVPVLPCQAGTENLLAKELCVPGEPRDVVRAIKTAQTIDCDLGRINDRQFMLLLGIGFDGEVVRRLSASRTGHISHLSYFWPIWRTFWEHDFPRMRIWADGEEVFNDFGLAFVGNISRYAVGLRICSEARFDDGLLDLVVFSCRERANLVLHAAWTLLRVHPLKGGVVYRRFKTARIETDRPVPTQADGDVGPMTPVDISVLPTRVRLIVPANCPILRSPTPGAPT